MAAIGQGFAPPKTFRGSGDVRKQLDANWKYLATYLNSLTETAPDLSVYVKTDGSRDITGTQRFTNATAFILGGAGDCQLRWVEQVNGFDLEISDDLDVFAKRIRFLSPDHGTNPGDVIFYKQDGSTELARWDQSEDQFEFKTDVEIGANRIRDASDDDILPGTLTKLDPPTWGADTTNPTATVYDDNSVGFWYRVGNVVFFHIHWIFDSAGLGATDDGVGNYYWQPDTDGAPAIDSAIYGNSENREIVCGVSRIKYSGQTNQEVGVAIIDNTNGRIYATLDDRPKTRVSNAYPLSWDEDDELELSGWYYCVA